MPRLPLPCFALVNDYVLRLVVQPLLRVSCFANLWGGNFRPSPEVVRIQDKAEQVGWNES